MGNSGNPGFLLDNFVYGYPEGETHPLFDLDFLHESINDTTVIKCYTCMDDGIIIVDFAPGIGIAGERNCPDCGDGERIR